MTTIDDLPVFAGDIEQVPVGRGEESKIYSIPAQNLALKVYHYQHYDYGDNVLFSGVSLVGEKRWSPQAIAYARREAAIAERLYQEGVSVPKPNGVFAFFLPEIKARVPAFVMEYIPGIEFSLLPSEHKAKAKMLYDFNIETARRVGFSIRDSEFDLNVFYTVEDDSVKAYLHDFTGWGHPNISRWLRTEESASVPTQRKHSWLRFLRGER